MNLFRQCGAMENSESWCNIARKRDECRSVWNVTWSGLNAAHDGDVRVETAGSRVMMLVMFLLSRLLCHISTLSCYQRKSWTRGGLWAPFPSWLFLSIISEVKGRAPGDVKSIRLRCWSKIERDSQGRRDADKECTLQEEWRSWLGFFY